jgi:hypothetical protein
MTNTSLSLKSALFALAAAIFMAGGFGVAHAQSPTTSLRNPLIQGAPNAPAGQAPQQGSPPPIGSGDTPTGVTPGMTGTPLPPPSAVSLPPMSPLDRGPGGQVNSLVAPYLTPPPSTPGPDPGMLPNNGYPSAIEVNINAGGGMPGDQAPQTRTGRQTTRDLGLKRTNGSTLTDFGQLLPDMPNLKVTPQYSQDGPRPVATTQGEAGGTRSPNLAGAQTTQNLYGNRTLFRGANERARATIAPY